MRIHNFEYREEVPEPEGRYRTYSFKNGVKHVEVHNERTKRVEREVFENLKTHETVIVELNEKGEAKEIFRRMTDGTLHWVDVEGMRKASLEDPIGAVMEALETGDWGDISFDIGGRPLSMEGEFIKALEDLDDTPRDRGH